MSFRIKQWSAAHQEGTKYYQVFLVEADGCKNSFIVTHWGPITTTLEQHRPIHDGQSKVKAVRNDAGEWEADRARSAKSGRGYKFAFPKVFESSISDSFEHELASLFKSATVKSMMAEFSAISGTTESVEEISDDELLDQLFPPEKEETSEGTKNAEWGTW